MRILACLLRTLLLLPTLAVAATPGQADAWLTAKDPRAATAVATLLKAQPGSAEVHVLHARLLLQQRKPADAIDAATRAIDRDPRHAQAHYWLGNAYGQRIGQVGMLRQAAIAPKLRDAFEQALVLDPAIHEARLNLIEFYLQAPSIAGGSVEKAQAHAAELSRRDPPRGDFARGRLAMHAKDYPVAAEAFAKALRARPESASFRQAAGAAYVANAQWPEALKVYQDWIREDPKATAAHYQLGRAAALSGQFLAEGESALRTYLAMAHEPGQPPHHHAWFRLGQVQAHAGNKVAARVSFQAALKADPGNSDFKAALSAL